MPWKETCAMEERLKLMLEWNEEEASVSELSRCYGVSRKTAYKWRSRYQREGLRDFWTRAVRRIVIRRV